jgi:hypothetical protein
MTSKDIIRLLNPWVKNSDALGNLTLNQLRKMLVEINSNISKGEPRIRKILYSLVAEGKTLSEIGLDESRFNEILTSRI